MGVFSLSHALGFAIGAPLGGQILSRWGPTVLWPTCFVITMIAAGVYWLIHVRIAHLLVIDEDSALEADLAN
jgi:predicted MFS family arabinose efflux permease